MVYAFAHPHYVEKGKNMYREDRERGDRFNRPPRAMHQVTCSDCGKETEVPFKPTEGRPVYCRECFSKHKPKY